MIAKGPGLSQELTACAGLVSEGSANAISGLSEMLGEDITVTSLRVASKILSTGVHRRLAFMMSKSRRSNRSLRLKRPGSPKRLSTHEPVAPPQSASARPR